MGTVGGACPNCSAPAAAAAMVRPAEVPPARPVLPADSM
jgi:hypothetical protein